jgi:hypothetical protein
MPYPGLAHVFASFHYFLYSFLVILKDMRLILGLSTELKPTVQVRPKCDRVTHAASHLKVKPENSWIWFFLLDKFH